MSQDITNSWPLGATVVATSIKEKVMSQRSQRYEQSNPRNAPTSEHQKQEPPTGGISPDDPFPVEEPGTGKPAQLQK
ncbi:MAG TPA: hypothetical protein VNO30_40355 [Kofleriaceae bacterium]|nr:hypothetical protein [Kofleriaceae bacterium]